MCIIYIYNVYIYNVYIYNVYICMYSIYNVYIGGFPIAMLMFHYQMTIKPKLDHPGTALIFDTCFLHPVTRSLGAFGKPQFLVFHAFFQPFLPAIFSSPFHHGKEQDQASNASEYLGRNANREAMEFVFMENLAGNRETPYPFFYQKIWRFPITHWDFIGRNFGGNRGHHVFSIFFLRVTPLTH